MLLASQPCCLGQVLSLQQPALWLAGTVIPPRDSVIPSVPGHLGGRCQNERGLLPGSRLHAQGQERWLERKPMMQSNQEYMPHLKPLLGDFGQTWTWG